MSMTRRIFLARTAGLVAALNLPSATESASAAAAHSQAGKAAGETITLPPVSLHGYGTLSAIYRPMGDASLTHIVCTSRQNALLVQSKYLSDMERIPGTAQDTLKVQGKTVAVRRTELGSIIACYAHDQHVLIVTAPSVARAKTLLEGLLPTEIQAIDFTPRRQVPMYLDRWDKHGLLIYYAPGQMPPGYSDDSQAYDSTIDLKFTHDNDLGLVLWTNPATTNTAEGLTNEANWAWIQENAKRMGIPVHINTSYSYPVVWLSNHYREQTQLKAPQFLGGFYGVGHDSSQLGAISWAAEEAWDAYMGVFQHTVHRFAPDANVVGWLEPHGETAQSPQGLFLEYGPYADKSFSKYLRVRYGSLSALSTRWQGSANYYKSWDEIRLPEVAEFAGFGPNALDLRGTWKVKYAPAAVLDEWYTPGFDDSKWDSFTAPGNDRMLRMPRNPLVYRRTIDVTQVMASGSQVLLYVWEMGRDPNLPPIAYINGQKVEAQSRFASGFHWSFFDVTHAVKPGANSFVLNIPQGIICYRMYLTNEPHHDYPQLGPQKNALWADFIGWNGWSRGQQIRRGAEMIRQVDPDRSINFMAAEWTGPIGEVCREYGGRFHDTGAMAGFWTEEPSIMMRGIGLPVTAEAGNGAQNAEVFQAFWGRWLTEALNGVHYFQTLGEIMWKPDVLAMFEKNRRMYEMVGKYHAPFAKLAILFSSRNSELLGFPWDPGTTGTPEGGYYRTGFHGDLMSLCPRDGVSEEYFDAPNSDKYRMVIDCNTSIMNDKVLGSIERWVRAGGIFMTYEQTGRHSEVLHDSWPISQLSGYQVLGTDVNGAGLTVSPVAGQTLLTDDHWAHPFRGGGYALKKQSADCRDLVLWSDGSVAVGMRRIGKGWVIHTGLMMDNTAMARMMYEIAHHFGAAEPVPARLSGGNIHLRHYVSNSGLYDIFVLYSEGQPAATPDLIFQPNFHPSSVTDIVTGESFPVVRDAAGDAIRGIKVDTWQSRMLISPRADVSDAPLEWLTLQRGWWQGTTKPPMKPLPSPKEQQHNTIDLTHDWAYKRIDDLTDAQATALAQPDFDDHTWERRDLDAWLYPGDLKPKRLMLRQTFTIPKHWNAGRVFLTTVYERGAFQPAARTLVDGKPYADRFMQNGPMSNDFGGIFKAGTTHVLAIDFKGSSSLIGWKQPMWVYYLPDAPAHQDLAGTWDTYSDATHLIGPAHLPGNLDGVAYASRTVTIDQAHQNSNVVIFVEGGVRGVLVNGKELDIGPDSRLIMNVTPFVHFGQENTIELYGPSQISTVEIRFYERGVYP